MKSKVDDNTTADWIAAYSEGLTAMKNIGEAKRGDRTMVDALEAGLEYLQNNQEFNQDQFVQAIRNGADYA